MVGSGAHTPPHTPKQEWGGRGFQQTREDQCGSAACGLDEAAAARMMGHCLSVWDAAYDKSQQQRASAHVQQVMPTWRSQLLLQQQGGSDLLKEGKQALLDKGFND